MASLHIAQPLTLPSGLELPNRLVKAAMAEALSKDGLPTNPSFLGAYSTWATGGWGLILTGNVQIDQRHLGQPGDVALLDDEAAMLPAWKAWAAACKSSTAASSSNKNTPVLVQVNHPGRQSPLGAGTRGFFEKTLAPSPVPLQLGSGLLGRVMSALLFGTPREMAQADIDDVVRRFAATARLSAEAGFDGVEIHAAHGYLLAQFLSAQTNRRTDAYGGDAVRRARIVVEVVRAMRDATPAGFTIGIKLNSVDHQSDRELGEVIAQLQAIVEAGIDFVEISGGSYEDPKMMQQAGAAAEKMAAAAAAQSERTKAREAFFLDFAQAIRHRFAGVPLMVTGGFATRQGLETAVAEGGCDLVGVGRPAVLDPLLPQRVVLNAEVSDEDAKMYRKEVPAPWLAKKIGAGVGAGAVSRWYSQKIGEMAYHKPSDL